MLHNISGMTGGNDNDRCPFRVGCRKDHFLLPRYHGEAKAARTVDVVEGQWELAVITMANWMAVEGGVVSFHEGEALVKCPVCARSIPYASETVKDSGIIYCRDAHCWGADRPVSLLANISYTAMCDAFSVCRRLAGGVRAYPMLRGLKVELQAPVLHCTGFIAKLLVYFILACLPEDVAERSRRVISAITAKGNVQSLYLREFRELVAAAVACPAIFTEDLDPAFTAMLQLVQLINAAWRAALTDPTDADRFGAAAIAQLAACVLGPLYLQLKPMDPVTKDAHVSSLYLHTPLAHLRQQVANNRAGVALVSDDNIEGHLRGVGRFLHNNANNASQAALFSDLSAVRDAALGFTTARSHPSSLVFTKELHVCPCWTSLSDGGVADFDAIRDLVEADPELRLLPAVRGGELRIVLPLHTRADANGERRRTSAGKPLLGKKEAMRRGLRCKQRVVTACHCGMLTGGNKSDVVAVLLRQRAAALVAAQDPPAPAASDAVGEARAPERTTRSGTESAGILVDPAATTDGAVASDGAESMSVSSGNERPTDNDTEGSQPSGTRRPPRARKPSRRARTIKEMPEHVPPDWALCQVLPVGSVAVLHHGRSGDVMRTPPAPLPERDAVLRRQVTVMRMTLMRARTYAFVSWCVRENIARDDFVEAARSVLDRLVATRTKMLFKDKH